MANALLKGKNGIIFGVLDEHSLAWQVALKCYSEGANVILSNNRVALRLGKIQKLAALINAPLFCTDVSESAQVDELLERSLVHFGEKIDFVLHSIAMGFNIRKRHAYTALNHTLQHKTLDVSALSLHRFLQVAMSKQAMRDWGSIVALSFIAAQRVFPGYNEMADAKALLESIARNFGYHYGVNNRVRINTISQSPTRTTAGGGINDIDRFITYTDRMSPLGNAPTDALAQCCVMLFSDYARYITMQNIFHDGGFSSMGISEHLAKA